MRVLMKNILSKQGSNRVINIPRACKALLPAAP